jgi:GWxTD domain-containing protein
VKIFRSLAAAAALLTTAPAVSAGQTAPALTVRAVRFWVPEYRQTVVKAFVQIPYIALTPTSTGPDGVMSYRVTVRVADSTGLTLMQQTWAKRAPGSVRAPGVTGFEMLEFAVAPGRFRLELTVDDSVSGAKVERTLEFQGFGDQPGASDLVIAPRMRIPGPADTIPIQGELRRGNTVFTATAEVQLTPIGDRSKLYYYLEAYTETADSGAITLEVRNEGGQVVLPVPARPVQFAAGGGVIRGQLDLTGLPEGRYHLRAALALRGRTIERGAPFVMGSLETALAQENELRTLRLVSDTGYFGEMSVEQLDESFAPLSYISTAEDRLAIWSPQLSVQAKRTFLVNFWKGRDQTLGTPRNEAREAFYARIAEADRRFTDQQRGSRPGWRTDMGRIHIRNGEPVEILRRSQVGLAAPYQVWRYSGARELWYVFVDRTNFGSYELVASTDPKEPSRPGWENMVGPDALGDIGRFLNVDFVRRSRSNTQ